MVGELVGELVGEGVAMVKDVFVPSVVPPQLLSPQAR
jgi:hypothetical protein